MRHTVAMKVDTAWFKKAIEESSEGTLRGVARKMRNAAGNELDPSALLRLINGEAEMTLRYAQQLSEVLGKPVLEVLKRCGLKV